MKYSILIPTYNSRFLKEAIESCLAQTYTDFELIIVNDHSPENLDCIVNAFSDDRIRYYINEKNFGAINVVDNWNKCLEYAKGEFIICIGDDDKLLPQCLENYNNLIDKYPELDVYHTRTDIIDEKSKITGLQEARPEWESVYSLIWHRNHGRFQRLGDFLFRSSALRSVGGFYKIPMGLSSDDISAVILAKNKGIANTNSFGFQYRNHSSTLSNSGNIHNTCEGVIKAKQWYKNFLSTPSTDSIDDKMRFHTLMELDNYYKKMFLYLMNKDMDQNLKGAYKRWMLSYKRYGLEMYEVRNEYKRRKEAILRQKIRKFLGR